MLQRTLRRFSSGGGELFPTSKQAAHLTPSWLTERHVPSPPGLGKCYVEVTRPPRHYKWQATQPEVHVVTVAQMDAPAAPQNASVRRPSQRTVASTLAGVNGALSHKVKSFENSIAVANVEAQKCSESRMKTRDYAEHQQPARVRPGWESTTDIVELSEWMYTRIHNHRKLHNDNSRGYEKEDMIWEAKSAPSAVKK
ncbi:hypothetical protein TRSC58_02355 [Trypanosoma rangeli SC58]|uniref:Uncharacterized protein n=1 Tax=Trypanosoma rangeli SC58 TaxID=429131 RepID=A0A061J3A4_TRYRA|nr:hypothetical protein TRSC58_02355 [Trypanosoma rangeli SC58]